MTHKVFASLLVSFALSVLSAHSSAQQQMQIGDAFSHCTPAERRVINGTQDVQTIFFFDKSSIGPSVTVRRASRTDDNLISATFSAIRRDPPGRADLNKYQALQLVSRVHGQCLAAESAIRSDGTRALVLKPCSDQSMDTYWTTGRTGIAAQFVSRKAEFIETGRMQAPGHDAQDGVVYLLQDQIKGNWLNGIINNKGGQLRVGGNGSFSTPSWLCSGALFAESRIPRTDTSTDLHPWSGSETNSQVVTNDYMIQHFRRALSSANHDVVSDPERDASEVQAMVNFGRLYFPSDKAIRDVFYIVAATSREREGANWLNYAKDRVDEFQKVLVYMGQQATSSQSSSVAAMQQLLDAVGINNINQAIADSGRGLSRLDTNARLVPDQVPTNYGVAARLDRELRRALLANSTLSDSSSAVEHVDPKYSAGYGMSATVSGQFRMPVVRAVNLFGIPNWTTTQNLRVSVPVFAHQRTNMYDGPVTFPTSTNTTLFTVTGAMTLHKGNFSLPNWRPAMQRVISPIVGIFESEQWIPEIEVHVTVRCTNGISASNCVRDQVTVGVVADRTLFNLKNALIRGGLYLVTESVRRAFGQAFRAIEADARTIGQRITRAAYLGALSVLATETIHSIDRAAMLDQIIGLRGFYWSAGDAVSEMEAGVLNTVPTRFTNAASQLRNYMPEASWHSSIFTEGGIHVIWVRDSVTGNFSSAPAFVQFAWTNFIQANGAMSYAWRRDPVSHIPNVTGATQVRVQGSVSFPILLPTSTANVRLLSDPRVRQNLAATQAAISGGSGGD